MKPEEAAKDFGKRLKKQIAEGRATRSEIMRRTDLNASYLSLIVNGKINIKIALQNLIIIDGLQMKRSDFYLD